MGKIYLIESPNGRKYIGQTIYKVKNRWRDHLYDAFDPKKDKCKALNNCIRKHNGEGFTITVLLKINDELLDHYEELFIEMYHTIVPYGLNIKLGGSSTKHSEETKEKISNTLKGKTVSNETRIKLSNTQNPDLPMYIIKFMKNNEHIGYRVSNHPNGFEKCFTNKQITLDKTLELAKNHLEFLDNLEIIDPITKLPKYLQKYGEGYCVKYPEKRAKYFVSTILSTEDKYNLALKFLENLTIKDKVQRLDGNGSS